MTDSLEAAIRLAEQQARIDADRRARVTRMRQARVRREEAIRRYDELREIERLMCQAPGLHR